ncbi:SUKH-4 family immunity protein [Streptomyces sp. CA-111067]|uniref:SUKH-4 family immunity protein n=1 Tax=Streptomyces sp. CA-111067 TaxID=3240046 RepID=UPI003D986253
MVTFAQAQERAERWINGDVPAYQAREIRVREFDLGFVVWSEPREDGPSAVDGGDVRIIIARDSGEATLWPGLPIGELIRRFEEEYGPVPNDAVPEPPERIDLEATSFLLSPPQWLQDAADRMGIPDRRTGGGTGSAAAGANPSAADAGSGSGSGIDYRRPAAAAPESAGPRGAGTAGVSAPGWEDGSGSARSAGSDRQGASGSGSSSGIDYRRPGGDPAAGDGSGSGSRAAASGQGGAGPSGYDSPQSGPGIDYRRPGARGGSAGAESGDRGAAAAAQGSWAGKTVSDSGEGESVAPPATVFAPPISGADRELPEQPGPGIEAATELMPGGSALPPTRLDQNRPQPQQAPAPPAPSPQAPPGVPHTTGGSLFPPPGGAPVALPPPAAGGGAADIADLETAKAVSRGSIPASRPARSPDAPPPPAPAPPAGGYVPPQNPSQGPQRGASTPPPPPANNDPHYAATMLAGPSGPPPPPPPPANNDPHYAATMLAGPSGPPPPPGPAQGPAGKDPHYAATMLAGAGGMAPPPPPPSPQHGGPGMAPPPPPAYGYPQPANVPTVGPGYMAVLRYRGQDGSEQQLIRRSAPGTPHPEWQILHELRSIGVRPEQVLELHTELESCDLPGGYCTRMIRETWPQVRISHTAPYGHDHASRRQGVQHLLTHQGELHQVAGAPARPQPQRVPMPDPHSVQRVPPVPLDVIGQELSMAFGPQGLFRFDQRAVSRQGVPEIVAQTLMWSGLPVDFGPFFWAQAQPGQPVPTLAELAQQRGVQPAADAGSYLVMGNDFGRQLCVQYGTAHIVAVPLEAGPGGTTAAVPQFVNSSLPEFARCLALLGGMWRLRIGLTPEQAGHWTVDFQAQLAAQDPAAIASPDNWWSVLIEQMWDGLL